jgi:signal transduction histidine kinase
MCRAEGRQEIAPHLAKMNNQIDKLTKLVVDLLDISKMQAGQIEMAHEAVNMEALAREVIESLQPTTGHRLLLEETAPGTISGDGERLGQVLTILLNNAIKYSPHADSVIVRLARSEEEHTLTVAVQDFGIGIGKEHQGRIFERFYRVLSKQDKTFPGMGIGLYIAYEIIQRHGGRMWVESAEGRGSTFFFSLPV